MHDQMKILVVDDDEGTRELLQAVLSKEGYLVTLAANGEQALALFKGDHFDLVISDINMPVTDGLQLLREIRRHDPAADVIMATGFGEAEAYIKAISLGAVEYINKPIQVKELRKIVQKVLEQKRKVKHG